MEQPPGRILIYPRIQQYPGIFMPFGFIFASFSH